MQYNGKLAITAFICGLGSIPAALIITILVGRIGMNAVAVYSIANQVMTLLERLLLVPLIIAFFKQSKALNYIAIGIETLIIILMIAIPGPMMRLYGTEAEYFSYGIGYLRTTALIWFVLAGLCVLFSFVIRRKRMMFCLIMIGASTVLSVVLGWILMYGLMGFPSIGLTGAAFTNITQPFQVLLPLLLLNPDREANSGRPAPIPGQEYTKE